MTKLLCLDTDIHISRIAQYSLYTIIIALNNQTFYNRLCNFSRLNYAPQDSFRTFCKLIITVQFKLNILIVSFLFY